MRLNGTTQRHPARSARTQFSTGERGSVFRRRRHGEGTNPARCSRGQTGDRAKEAVLWADPGRNERKPRKWGPPTGPRSPRKARKQGKLRASARPDRTQEVAGSSPASSIKNTCNWALTTRASRRLSAVHRLPGGRSTECLRRPPCETDDLSCGGGPFGPVEKTAPFVGGCRENGLPSGAARKLRACPRTSSNTAVSRRF